MQMRNAARVLPEPVGAEMSTGLPSRMTGQPSSCGSVGVPKRRTNHSCTSGCAHSKEREQGGNQEPGSLRDWGHRGEHLPILLGFSFLLRPCAGGLAGFRQSAPHSLDRVQQGGAS